MGGGAIIAFDDSAGNSGNNGRLLSIESIPGETTPGAARGQIRHLGNWPTGLQMVSDGANGAIASGEKWNLNRDDYAQFSVQPAALWRKG